MNYFNVTIHEFDLLSGSSSLAFRLYIVLRRFMDHQTGTVGQSKHVSYQMFAEQCEKETPKGKGWHIEKPSVKELRGAIAGLERMGLIQRIVEDAPVFALPHAQKSKMGQKQTGLEQVTNAAEKNITKTTTCEEKYRPSMPEPGTHLNSKYNKETATATREPVDNSKPAAAAFLASLAEKLGYPILADQNHPRLAEWEANGTTQAAVETAVIAAVAARRRDKNPAPINPGYIAAFMAEATEKTENWRDTWSGIVSHAKTLGINQAAGEPCPAFKQRVFLMSEVA